MLPKARLSGVEKIMRNVALKTARVPVMVVAGLLGALMSGACGGGDPESGGGLGTAAKGGTTGSGGKGSGGTSGSINVGAGGTSGSIGAGGSSGSSGSSGTAGTAGTASCAEIVQDSSKVDVALLFMVDISGSMNCPVPETKSCTVDPKMYYDTTRWTEMAPALKDFFGSITADDGIWAGISFFSRHGSCTVSDYEKPDAEIALLPGAATSLGQAVDKQTPSGSTPTVPSLQGALNHAESWATAHTDQNVVVVYATDGYPQGCSNNTIDAAATIAGTAFSQHQIRTYVLGVGPNLTDLNKVASSGGTDQAFFIDTGQDVTAQLTAKFNEIRTDVAVDCTYTVPTPPAGQTLDPNTVNVQSKSGSNSATIPFNDTMTCDQGWQYSADKSQIILCGSTCDQIKADHASIQMTFGCRQTVKVGDPR